MKDKADVVELIRVNREQSDSIRKHLMGVHPLYASEFDALIDEARKSDVQR